MSKQTLAHDLMEPFHAQNSCLVMVNLKRRAFRPART